jgi:hypothetical protein
MTLALWVAIAYLLACVYTLAHRVKELERDSTAAMLGESVEFNRADLLKLRRDVDAMRPVPKPQPTVDELYPLGIVDFTRSVSGKPLPPNRSTLSQ